MAGEKNAGHGKLSGSHTGEDVATRDLGARNHALGSAPEEPRDVRKAGGGTVGASQGGATTGRFEGSPGKATSKRERKPRGGDKDV